jgi:type VI secretion system protein ImpL
MSVFKRRALLVAIGLLLLALFIWFGGPYLAFADVRPLDSVIARLVAILILVMLWALSLLLKQLRAGRASNKLAQAVVAQREPAGRDGASREAAQLRERFEEAVATLKKSQRAGRSLYELPWYVIIGPPGSGKTTALVNSGLKFPLEQRFGKEALRGVGGTRNCDWWFTDEAVLLDTAGRYTTQDSDENADSAGWREFLGLLSKYRKRRPLNGIIVTLSAWDLMTQSAAEREANVAAVRRRLDELNRQLRVRLPIYVMVTKCDLIAGFSEYFDDLPPEGRAQVWGMTFPAEHSAAGTAAADFAAEFDALSERLNQRLFGRLEEERDLRRRTAVFAFPQQLAGLRALINTFVTEVFDATRFDGRLLLRGVYFTSGTQEGTPVDRLMAAISRGFALAPEAVTPAAAGRGKAYFIEKLLREVLFAEAGLAGVNRRRELQMAAAQLALYAGLVLFAVLGVIVLSVSYQRNKSYLTEVAQSLTGLQGVPVPSAGQTLPQMLPGLDALCVVVDTANRYRGNWSLTRRAGLYQGGEVGEEATQAYRRELNGSLLPSIASGLQRRLQSSATDPDRLYQYLKAYLMLGEPKHLDKAQLGYLVTLDWQDTYGAQPDILQSLVNHLHALIDDQDALRAMPLDDTLIGQTRNTLQQAQLPRLMYDQLKLSRSADPAHDLRLDIAFGVGSERVLVRKSGKPLDQPVSGLYTRAVFDEINTLGTAELVKQFSADSWVMGQSALDLQASARMAAQVMEVYADDYIRTWDGLIADIEPVSLKGLAQTTDVLGILAGPTSPLKGLLVTVDANTNLTKPLPGAKSAGGVVSAAEQAVLNPLNRMFAGGQPKPGALTPAARVTAHFAAVNQLVAGSPPPIDAMLAQLGQIQQKLSGLGSGVGDTNPLDALSKSNQGEAVKALQQQAAALPPAIGALVTQLVGRSESVVVGQARSELDQRYREQVVKACEEVVAGRYPFTAASAIDTPLADFGRVFGTGGVFDAFFRENLAPLVDTTRSPWVWRAGATGPVGASVAMLRQFELAATIRQDFFGPSGTLPEQHFNLTTGDLDAAAVRFTLELDGQSLDYRFGPQRTLPVVWPGPSPGAATVTIEERSGARLNVPYQGPWAWFRLLEAAHLRALSDVRFEATFQLGAHQGSVIVEANSVHNPYLKTELRQFRCAG